jgi:hydrogenase maturation protease
MGNPEMGDDGIGVHLAEMLREQVQGGDLPVTAEIVCADRDPLLAGALLAEGKRVLLIDAVDMKQKPGAWRLFTDTDLPPCRLAASGSTHALDLAQVIELARGLGCADRLRILGIQVGDVRPGRFLSPLVRRCVSEVVTRIREEAEALP